MDDLSLSALLRTHRRISLLTQEELAEAAGLSVRSVRNLESGAVRSPRTSSVHRIACALRLDDAAYRQLADLAVSGRTDGHMPDEETAGPSAADPRIVALEPGANLIIVVNTSRATDAHGAQDHPVADHDGTRLIMLSLSLPTDVR
jgi:transcriptional regulator with XRE-family HTH domain